MNLAVLLYADDTNPRGIPGVWPSQCRELGESTTLPGPNWLLKTTAEYAAYRAEHQATYNEWWAVNKPDPGPEEPE